MNPRPRAVKRCRINGYCVIRTMFPNTGYKRKAHLHFQEVISPGYISRISKQAIGYKLVGDSGVRLASQHSHFFRAASIKGLKNSPESRIRPPERSWCNVSGPNVKADTELEGSHKTL